MIEKIIATLTREELKEFATDNGWKEIILTTTESPNYEIENPIYADNFLREKFNAPILEAYKIFKLKGATETAKLKMKQAQDELENAKESLSINEIIV